MSVLIYYLVLEDFDKIVQQQIYVCVVLINVELKNVNFCKINVKNLKLKWELIGIMFL